MANIVASAATYGTAAGGAGTTSTATITATAGSSIEVFILCNSGATITTPTSSPSETWTLVKAINDGATDGVRAEVWVANNVTGGSTVITETYSGSIGNRLMAAKEIQNTSGYDSAASASAVQMQNAPGTGTGVVTSGATATLTSQPALFSGWTIDKSFNNAAPAVTVDYTDDGAGGAGIAGPDAVRSSSKRVTATTGQAATFTNSTNRRYFTFVTAYLESGGGGGGSRPVKMAGVWGGYAGVGGGFAGD